MFRWQPRTSTSLILPCVTHTHAMQSCILCTGYPVFLAQVNIWGGQHWPASSCRASRNTVTSALAILTSSHRSTCRRTSGGHHWPASSCRVSHTLTQCSHVNSALTILSSSHLFKSIWGAPWAYLLELKTKVKLRFAKISKSRRGSQHSFSQQYRQWSTLYIGAMKAAKSEW